MRRLPFLLALALGLAACAGGTPDTDEAQPAAAEQPVEDTADEPTVEDVVAADDATAATDTADADETTDTPAETVDALWWTADTVTGGELASAELAGGNVVLWMWAPWCSVCNREAPEVAEVLAELPDDVTIVGVAGRDDVGPMQEFVAEHGLEAMTHVVDEDGSLWASYGISYQPAWVFVDEAGEVSVAAGALGREGVLDAIDQVFRS